MAHPTVLPIDLTGDMEEAVALTVAAASTVRPEGGKPRGWNAMKGRKVAQVATKREILYSVANLVPAHLFEEEELPEGKALFDRLKSDSKSKKEQRTADFLADAIFQIHSLLEQMAEARTARGAVAKRDCKEVQQLKELVAACQAMSDQEVAAEANTKKKQLVRQLKPTDKMKHDNSRACQFNSDFLDKMRTGEIQPFSFGCPCCPHKNCYPTRDAKEIDTINKQINASNKAGKANKSRTGKAFRSKPSVSQDVVCMCAGINCYLGMAQSTCKKCDKLLAEGKKPPTIKDPNDPLQEICACEVSLNCLCLF